MQLAMITAQQVAVLFLLIFTGAAATKAGILRSEGKQTLSGLLVNVVVPAMILNSYQMEFSMEILRNLLAAFGLSVLAILLGTGVTVLLTARRKDSRASIFRFAFIFSNAAYMGFPLISALFGAEGLLYASAYVTVFNLLLWTLGYGLVSGKASARELGVSIIDGFTPVAVEGNKVTFKHVRLPGELTMAADKIILAVGQHARLDAFAELEPQRNTIKTQNYQTRDPQV